MKVDKNKLVKVQYTLYSLENGKETEVEKTQPGHPMVYVHGLGLMLDAFEQNLLGLSKGDKFDFTLEAKEAYGERSEDFVLTLPKETFFVDGKFDDEIVYVGAIVPMMNAEGEPLQGTVLEVDDKEVKMDFNHPLADTSLHFVGHIEDVSEPTAEEMAEFMPSHGDCCGCSSSGCGGCC